MIDTIVKDLVEADCERIATQYPPVRLRQVRPGILQVSGSDCFVPNCVTARIFRGRTLIAAGRGRLRLTPAGRRLTRAQRPVTLRVRVRSTEWEGLAGPSGFRLRLGGDTRGSELGHRAKPTA